MARGRRIATAPPPRNRNAAAGGRESAAVRQAERGAVGRGRLAYVADWDGELWVIDLTDPAAPRVIGRATASPYESDPWDPLAGLAVEGRHAYLLHWGGVSVVDVSDPQRPRQVGAFRLDPEATSSPGMAYADAVVPALSGDRLLLPVDSYMVELDISRPIAPRLARVFELDPEMVVRVHNVVVDGTSAWLGLDMGVVGHVDLSGPQMRRIARADLDTGDIGDLAVVGDHVVLDGAWTGLVVVDRERHEIVAQDDTVSILRLSAFASIPCASPTRARSPMSARQDHPGRVRR